MPEVLSHFALFISEPGDMISSFQNGQVEPPAYIVLFSLLLSPVVCAGLMYKAERNKLYFKEDFLGTFLDGAFLASYLFASCVLITLIAVLVTGNADASLAKMLLLSGAMFAICAVAIFRSKWFF